MEIFKSKTFWTAVIGAITAIGAYLTGSIDAAQAVEAVFGALVVIFLRQGVAKSGPNGA